MGEIYGDGPDWVERSGWTLFTEIRRWTKCWLSAVPGRLGSFMRRKMYGFRSCGDDLLLCEGLWVDYPGALDLGNHVSINRNATINAGGGVTIGDWVMLGPGVTIYSQNHDLSRADIPLALVEDVRVPVYIGEGAWLGANSMILAGVTVGGGAVVAAGAVVTKDVAPFTIVGGIPAKAIGERKGHQSEVRS